jgi:hypothetical protein
MRSMMAKRNAVEDPLNHMARDEEVDGTRCDPPRDYDEAAYQRLRTQLDTHDRSLWATYAGTWIWIGRQDLTKRRLSRRPIWP